MIFFSHYVNPISYRNVIRKIPTIIGVTDFKKLTYKHCELLLNEYPTKGSNRSGIESLFKYLYLLDILAEKQKLAERFGAKETVRKINFHVRFVENNIFHLERIGK